MEFFITESQRKELCSTCYFEFQKGQKGQIEDYQQVFWREDSLLLHADIADEIELYKIIPNFDYYSTTFVDKQSWSDILQNAENRGGKILQVIREALPWAEDNFREFDYFVICGI